MFYSGFNIYCKKCNVPFFLSWLQPAILSECGHSDWLLLSLLLSNVNPVVGAVFLREVGGLKEYLVAQQQQQQQKQKKGKGKRRRADS